MKKQLAPLSNAEAKKLDRAKVTIPADARRELRKTMATLNHSRADAARVSGVEYQTFNGIATGSLKNTYTAIIGRIREYVETGGGTFPWIKPSAMSPETKLVLTDTFRRYAAKVLAASGTTQKSLSQQIFGNTTALASLLRTDPVRNAKYITKGQWEDFENLRGKLEDSGSAKGKVPKNTPKLKRALDATGQIKYKGKRSSVKTTGTTSTKARKSNSKTAFHAKVFNAVKPFIAKGKLGATSAALRSALKDSK